MAVRAYKLTQNVVMYKIRFGGETHFFFESDNEWGGGDRTMVGRKITWNE